MSKEQIKDFLLELKKSTNLQQRLKAGNVTERSAFIKIANDAGFDFTAEEWREYAKQVNEARNVKLTDDELDKVSAGGLGGLTQCPEKYDYWLCMASFCPNVRSRMVVNKTSYSYCLNGFWDEEKGTGPKPDGPVKDLLDWIFG